MKLRILSFVLSSVVFLLIEPASCSTCSSTQYDMLNWFSVARTQSTTEHLIGNANPVYVHRDSKNQRFYWIKGAAGYPVDVNYYDSSYIYQWATEYNWNDPTSYKAFSSQMTMPWSPRCVERPPVGVYGGLLASIRIPSAPYTVYASSCTASSYNDLGSVVNEIWGPVFMSLGGSLPNDALTLTLAYQYGCNGSYESCQYKETFDLQKPYGLVRWTYFVLQTGQYVQENQAVFNNQVSGGAPHVDHPCWH